MSTGRDRLVTHIQLPEDVCYLIASHIRRPSDLRNWMLTDRKSYNGGLRHLYHSARLRFGVGDKVMIDNFCSPDNKGLRHIRHLKLLPQMSMSRYIARWHPEDGTEHFGEFDFEKSEERSRPFHLMIHKIIRSVPSDRLLSFIAHRFFSSKAIRLLMRHQTCLEYLHLDPHKPWSARAADRIKPTHLKSLSFPWCGLQADDLTCEHGRELAHLISTNTKLECLVIDHSHHSVDDQHGWASFWIGMSSLSLSPLMITKLELYHVVLPDDWKELPVFSNVAGLRSLRLVGCEDTEAVVAALQASQTSGPMISLHELFIFNVDPDDLGRTQRREVGDRIRDQLKLFLQSSSGLRKLSLYLDCNARSQLPIEMHWLANHASTLQYLELQCAQPIRCADHRGYICITELEELCTTLPNLRQLGLPLFYHPSSEIVPMFLAAQSQKWMQAIAKLKHLRAFKSIGLPGIKALYDRTESIAENRERNLCQLRHLAFTYFYHLGDHSKVNVIAFTDPTYDWHDVREGDRFTMINPRREYSSADAMIYLRSELPSADESGMIAYADSSSYDDVVYAEEPADLVHWKNIRWSLNKPRSDRQNSMYPVMQWPE